MTSDIVGAATKGRVLIVDDSAVVRNMLSSWLVGAGYTVGLAANGTEALRAIESNYDVVVTDIGMPELGGLGLLAAVRCQLAPPEVIVLTGEDAGGVLESQAFGLGAHDYLQKPSGVETILASVGGAMARRRLRNVTTHLTRQLQNLSTMRTPLMS